MIIFDKNKAIYFDEIKKNQKLWKLFLFLKFPIVHLPTIMRDKIVEKASELFLNFGFKSVTMDDIAKELGASKKTLYKYFNTKISLVRECTTIFHEACLCEIGTIVDKKMNPIQENFEIQKVFKEMFKNASASPVYQLKKYYPKIHEKIMHKEFVAFSECSKRNLNKGIEFGFYRKDIQIDLCSQFYFTLIFSVHENIENKQQVALLEQQTLVYHTRAIATEKGIKELEIQLKQYNLA